MKKIIKKIVEGAVVISLLTVPAAVSAVEPATNNETQHYINLEGQACTRDGSTEVKYTAISWAMEGTGGLNANIEISYQYQVGNQVSGYIVAGNAPFADPSRTIDGDFVVDKAVDRITLITTAKAKWGNGTNGGQMTTTTIHPAACEGEEWDKSSLAVVGECAEGEARFYATNHGSAMTGTTVWELYQNGGKIQFGAYQWAEGEARTFAFGYDGVLRFLVYQRPGHPGNSLPQATVNTDDCALVATATATATTTATATATPKETGEPATETPTKPAPTHTPTATPTETMVVLPTTTTTTVATIVITPTATTTRVVAPTITPSPTWTPIIITPTATATLGVPFNDGEIGEGSQPINRVWLPVVIR